MPIRVPSDDIGSGISIRPDMGVEITQKNMDIILGNIPVSFFEISIEQVFFFLVCYFCRGLLGG